TSIPVRPDRNGIADSAPSVTCSPRRPPSRCISDVFGEFKAALLMPFSEALLRHVVDRFRSDGLLAALSPRSNGYHTSVCYYTSKARSEGRSRSTRRTPDATSTPSPDRSKRYQDLPQSAEGPGDRLRRPR